MKFINKISALLCLLSVVMFTSCDQQNEGEIYKNATGSASGLTFTSSSLSAVTVTADSPYAYIDLLRANGDVAESGEVEMTVSVGNNILADLLKVDGYVFEEGQTKTTIKIDASALEVGLKVNVSLKLNADNSELAVTETSFAISKDYSWEPLGTGLWSDGLICTLFQVEAGVQWEVEVEKAIGFDVYRMVNAYGLGVCPWVAEGEVTVDPCYITIDAIDPNAVFVSEASMGIDWGYGEFYVGSVFGQLSTSPSYTLGTKTGNEIDLGDLYVGMGADNGPYLAKPCKLVLPE